MATITSSGHLRHVAYIISVLRSWVIPRIVVNPLLYRIAIVANGVPLFLASTYLGAQVATPKVMCVLT